MTITQTPQATKPGLAPIRQASPVAPFPTEAILRSQPEQVALRSDQTPDAAEVLPASSGCAPHRVTTPAPAKRMPATRPTMPEQGTTPTAAAKQDPQSYSPAPLLSDPFLNLAAAMVDDLEKVRMANANRLRILTTPVDQEDEDGVRRGFGLTEDHRDVARLAGMVKALEVAEHDAVLTLQAVMRRHPLGPWVKSQVGIGEKQAARLLAAIGDPYWNDLHDRPRTVSQLWAYSGLHVVPGGQKATEAQPRTAAGALDSSASQVPGVTHVGNAGGGQAGGSDPGQVAADALQGSAGVAARRKKGVKANWSTDAKTRAYLIATSCIKQASSPYRAKYDGRRARTGITHPDWTAGHSHNDALRITAKEVLKQFWRESRRLHGVIDVEP